KNAAGAQIDLAIHRRPGRRREPLLDVLRHGPRSPDEFRWNVDDAFEKQVEERIGFNVEAGHGPLSFRSFRKLSSWLSRRFHRAPRRIPQRAEDTVELYRLVRHQPNYRDRKC